MGVNRFWLAMGLQVCGPSIRTSGETRLGAGGVSGLWVAVSSCTSAQPATSGAGGSGGTPGGRGGRRRHGRVGHGRVQGSPTDGSVGAGGSVGGVTGGTTGTGGSGQGAAGRGGRATGGASGGTGRGRQRNRGHQWCWRLTGSEWALPVAGLPGQGHALLAHHDPRREERADAADGARHVGASDVTNTASAPSTARGGRPPPPTPHRVGRHDRRVSDGALSSRLKIPIIYGPDVVHGVGPVRAPPFSPQHRPRRHARRRAGRTGRDRRRRGRRLGRRFPFAPVVAVARDERWGRTYESFGETRELPSAMGVAINGFQNSAGRSPCWPTPSTTWATAGP